MGASAREGEVRAALNQAIFRAVNGKIVELTESFGEEMETLEIACECADAMCAHLVSIDADAYAAVRRSPSTFVVLSDHVRANVERIVSREDAYVVVEAITPPTPASDVAYTEGGAHGQ